MIYGTSHFVSKQAAIRYYTAYESYPWKAVDRKLLAGEIHVGPPKLKEGEHCYVKSDEGRYFITDGKL